MKAPFRRTLPLVANAIALTLVSHSGNLFADLAPQKPNIVFILADDLGWKDLGCYGTYSFETPNIDRLAHQGIRFTQAYVCPLSSPTRASLMTGMDPARLGITLPSCHMPNVVLTPKVADTDEKHKWQKLVCPVPVTRLDTKYVSFAKILKESGYVTAHFGKWHLGMEPYSPLQHGFDVDIPHVSLPGPGQYIAPWTPEIAAGFKTPASPGENLEDRLCKEACAFIEKNKEKPFILDYWAFSVHASLNAKEEYVNKYKSIANSYSPQRNPVYAGMVKTLDDAVGNLMLTLEKTGLAKRTIVIFLSDNGGLGYWSGGSTHKEYQGIPATSNVPLRSGKGWVYEGGVRVPLIVKWPSVVKPDTVSNALVSSMDLYPTILEMGGARPRSDQPLDGVSIVPVLNGTKLAVRNNVFCVFPQYMHDYSQTRPCPAASIHDGDWKLIRFFADKPDNTDRYELYNLKDDLGEQFEMSTGMPDLTAKLSKKLDAYIANIHAVLPKLNPAYDPLAPAAPYKFQPSEPVNLPSDLDQD